MRDPELVYRDPEGIQRTVRLRDHGPRFTVGRAEEADLRLDWDARVSRFHAELERVGQVWTVADDGLSANGSFLNGERITARRRLRDGDAIRFGETVVTFHGPRDEGPQATDISPDRLDGVKLSDAQRRVLVALCRPFRDGSPYATPATNAQIAAELYLSVEAVKTHIRTLFEKFSVEDLPQNQKRARLVELAFQSGLIGPRDLR